MRPPSPIPNPLPVSAAGNLQRLVIVRAVVVAGQAAAVVVAVERLGMALPLAPVLAILGAQALVTVATQLRLWWAGGVRDAELFVQLLFDVAALSALLFFTGGATNPFVTLFLPPLAFAAVALPARYVWALAATAAAGYTLLLVVYVPLPSTHAGHAHDFGLHVLGMWLGFLLAAVLIAWFALRLRAAARERDRLAAEMRERDLRHERVLALGTLATGAAHELGTPLSTLAVLVNDLAPDRPVPAATLAILRGQIARCREILGSLTASAGAARAEGGTSRPLDAWLAEIVQKWRDMRPGVAARARFSGTEPAPRVVAEHTLAQAVTNILNNAADASPDSVEVEGRWSEEELVLEVADRGPGLAPEVRAAVGEPFTTTKEPAHGLGLGLFLAYTTLSRFGGTVRLVNREGGGVRCRLTLPLSAIRVPG